MRLNNDYCEQNAEDGRKKVKREKFKGKNIKTRIRTYPSLISNPFKKSWLRGSFEKTKPIAGLRPEILNSNF